MAQQSCNLGRRIEIKYQLDLLELLAHQVAPNNECRYLWQAALMSQTHLQGAVFKMR